MSGFAVAVGMVIDTPPEQTAPRGLDPTRAPLADSEVKRAVAADQDVRIIGQLPSLQPA